MLNLIVNKYSCIGFVNGIKGFKNEHLKKGMLLALGPLARGHLILPLGHLIWHSAGLDWPPNLKEQI